MLLFSLFGIFNNFPDVKIKFPCKILSVSMDFFHYWISYHFFLIVVSR